MSKKEYFDVKVIAAQVTKPVKHEANTIYSYTIGSNTHKQDKWTEEPGTRVLYTLGGVLKEKLFEGSWTLEQVSHWEKDRFTDESDN